MKFSSVGGDTKINIMNREIAGQHIEHHVKMFGITAHVVWARGSKAYDRNDVNNKITRLL